MTQKAPRRSSGIPHLDELSQTDQALFVSALHRRQPGFEISEKVDGSARITFGLHEGQLWTQSKHGVRRWTAESYGDRPHAAALREAHRALASRLRELRENWPEGVESMTADVLHTRVPNSIEYGREMLVIHSHPPDVVDRLSAAMGPMNGGWTLEPKNVVDPEKLGKFKTTAEGITEMLRHQTSAYGHGMIEGLVITAPGGRTAKLVDRARFTEMNKFMWHFRERLDRGVKTEGVWHPGLRTEMRRRLALEVLGVKGLLAPNVVRNIAEKAGDVDTAITRYLDQNGGQRAGYQAGLKAEAIVRETITKLDKLYLEWKSLREGNVTFVSEGWTQPMDELVKERTDAAFADMREQLHSMVGQLASLGGEDQQGQVLKMFLGPERMEKLEARMRENTTNEADGFTMPTTSAKPTTPATASQFSPPDPSNIDEQEARRYLTKFAPLMQQKRGLSIPPHPPHLGTGTRGAAFDIGGGRAIKVTADDREAKAANRLKTAGLSRVVKIYDVFRFKDSQIFAVVQDRLTELSGEEKSELNKSLVKVGLPVWLKQANFQWPETKRLTIEWLKKKSAKLDPEAAKKFLQEANAAWTLLVDKYKIKEMVEQLNSAGIEFQDYHAGNVMKQGSNYVLIDIGYSEVAGGAPPDVLERIVKEMVESTVASSMDNMPKNFDNARSQELAVMSKELLAKRGIDLGAGAVESDDYQSALEYLGGGSYGFAYEVKYKGKPACLKITEDPTEAKASNHIKGKNIDKVVKIYDVFQFKGKTAYGIVQELLKPLPSKDENEFDKFKNMLMRGETGEAIIAGDWEGVMAKVMAKFDDEQSEMFVELGYKFGFPDMIESIAGAGIQFLDYHSGNVMMRGKEYVVIDLGMSRSPGADPEIMERLKLEKHSDELSTHKFGFSGEYSGDDIYASLHKVEGLLKKHGVVVNLKKRLGNGVFGIAFEATYKGERCAAKITGEVNEAKTSNHIKGKELLHLCNVHEVFRIPTKNKSAQLFIIVQELLTQPTPEEKALFSQLIDMIYYGSGTDLSDYIQIGNVPWMLKKVRAGMLANKGAEHDMEEDDIDKFMILFKKFGIAGAIKEFHTEEIQLRDIHAENLMKRGEDFVFIDPGLARSPGAIPNMIEKAIRSLMEGKQDKIGVTIGRFQPFHKGHAEVLRRLASSHNKVVVIVAGNKLGPENPFSYDLRVDMMKRSLPDVAAKLEVYKAEFDGKPSGYIPGVLGSIVRDENSSVEANTAITILVGPDRFEEVQKQLDHARKAKEAGKEIFFDPDMAIVQKLDGVKDDDSTERVSATQVRNALAKDDKEAVKKLVDPHLMTVETEFEELYERMKKEMGQYSKPVKKESLDIIREITKVVVEELSDVGEPEILKILQTNADKLGKKTPFPIDASGLKKLGAGKMGVAFDMGGGKVLKVTTDEDEAKTCMHLLHQGSPPHVVKIFDVFQFPKGSAKVGLWGIVQELLSPLSSAEEKEFDSLIGLLEDDATLEPLYQGTWDEVLKGVRHVIATDVCKEMWPTDVGMPDPSQISPKMKAKLKKQVDAKLFEFTVWAEKYNVDKIHPELRSLDINFVDYHGRNMMKRGSTYVINDLGKGMSPGAAPPILESKKPPEDAKDVGFGFNAEGFPIMDRYEIQGLDICVENKKGSKRQWGEKSSEFTKMKNDYGYVDGYEGADGDEVDVYIGPDRESEWVYVVHQLKCPKFTKFDEDKVMLGFASEEKAKKAYLAHYDKDDFYGGMSVMKMADFKKQIKKREGKKITNEAKLNDLVRAVIEGFGGTMGSKGSSQWSRPPMMADKDDTDPLPHGNRKKR